MPGRKVVLANNEIYHVINKGVASQPIFANNWQYQRALNILFYYQNRELPLKYSHFIVESSKNRDKILANLRSEKKFWAEIIAYCLMPNHFHFLLKQKADHGISKFMGNFANSYTRYFNSRQKRSGPLFQGKFKAVRIETEEQLLHVSRYIHLNPCTAYVIKNIGDLENYSFSSYPEYLGKTSLQFCNKEMIFNYFKSKRLYQDFVFNQADYQRSLEEIKHLVLEK